MRRWQAAMAVDGFSPSNKKTTKNHVYTNRYTNDLEVWIFIPIFALNMIRYNLLASIKRTLDYDTIGGLFGDMYLGVHELTVVEKIWAIIIEVVAVVSEHIDADSDELTIQIIENDKRLAAVREYAQMA